MKYYILFSLFFFNLNFNLTQFDSLFISIKNDFNINIKEDKDLNKNKFIKNLFLEIDKENSPEQESAKKILLISILLNQLHKEHLKDPNSTKNQEKDIEDKIKEEYKILITNIRNLKEQTNKHIINYNGLKILKEAYLKFNEIKEFDKYCTKLVPYWFNKDEYTQGTATMKGPNLNKPISIFNKIKFFFVKKYHKYFSGILIENYFSQEYIIRSYALSKMAFDLLEEEKNSNKI